VHFIFVCIFILKTYGRAAYSSCERPEAKSKEKLWDPMPELTYPHLMSSPDPSNTFTMSNPMPESTLSPSQGLRIFQIGLESDVQWFGRTPINIILIHRSENGIDRTSLFKDTPILTWNYSFPPNYLNSISWPSPFNNRLDWSVGAGLPGPCGRELRRLGSFFCFDALPTSTADLMRQST